MNFRNSLVFELLLHKSPSFNGFLSLLFEKVFYSNESSITEFTVFIPRPPHLLLGPPLQSASFQLYHFDFTFIKWKPSKEPRKQLNSVIGWNRTYDWNIEPLKCRKTRSIVMSFLYDKIEQTCSHMGGLSLIHFEKRPKTKPWLGHFNDVFLWTSYKQNAICTI